MRRTAAVLVVAAMAGIASAAPSGPAWAAWPEFGRAITTAPNNQDDSHVAADGAGGAIIVWTDGGSGVVDLFAQHVLASGDLDPAWPIGGRALLTDPSALSGAAGTQTSPRIVSDGAGGAVVAWVDGRNGLVTRSDIFAQHVLATGQVDPRWPANGVALCTALGNQNQLTLVSDGASGAIATWMDARSAETGADIFAQHVLASGVVDPDWKPDGAGVCVVTGRQVFPAIDTDGAGGAIITWTDPRSQITSFDIYAQHLRSDGAPDPDWPDNGVAVCAATGDQLQSSILADGAHGALLAWTDDRNGTPHIFTHHVLASGSMDRAFPVDGLEIVDAPIEQQHALLVSDGRNGAIVSWEDQRSGTHNMYAQHLLIAGAVDARWPVNGIALSARPTEQTFGGIVEDGGGGAIVVWQDDFIDVFAQHVLASGVLDASYPLDGQRVAALPSVEDNPSVVSAGPSGAIVCWTDFRSGPTSDIFALQILTLITTAGVGDPPGSGDLSFAAPSPNPARESLTLRYRLPRESGVRLAIYDAAGRRVRQLASGVQTAGDHAIGWDLRDESGRSVGAGLYLARFEAEGRSFTQKVATLR